MPVRICFILLFLKGHYARLLPAPSASTDTRVEWKLLRGIDTNKDQSFFLSTLHQVILRRCLFPLGAMEKQEVKHIASEHGLDRWILPRESMGICFIGKKNLSVFLSDYVDEISDPKMNFQYFSAYAWPSMRLVSSDSVLLATFYTVGQRCRIRSQRTRSYVAGLNRKLRIIWLVSSATSPALMSIEFGVLQVEWTRGGAHSRSINSLHQQVQLKHLGEAFYCTFDPLRQSIRLQQPQSSISPGQSFALYEGEECVGGGLVSWTRSSCEKFNSIDRCGKPFD